jgi:4-amino-4-deoxy-L-arabinose transferase
VLNLLENIPFTPKVFLVLWFVFLITASLLFSRNSKYWLPALIGSAFCLASAFALFSPYFYTWDEQFHALVAKNCMSEPFHPKLFRMHPEAINIPHDQWVLSETWLHKQPLFTWLMALSMKLFGASVYAVRLPSVLLFTAMIPAIYRMGKLLFSRRTGLIAALLVLHSSYLLGLVSGRIGTDHNDAVFIALILFSFWAYVEWKKSEQNKWLYLIGIFVGLAVLTKWLVGLLVFFGWGIIAFRAVLKKKTLNPLKPIGRSFSIALLTFLPWQVYTFLRFPAEAEREMTYNSLHLWQSVEKHAGNFLYHFNQIPNLYFEQFLFYSFLAMSIVALVFICRKYYEIAVISIPIVVIYIFFAFAQTKMPSFTAVVIPLVLLLFAFGIDYYTDLIKNYQIKTIARIGVIITTVNLSLKPGQTLDAFGFKEGTELYKADKLRIRKHEFIQQQPKDAVKRIVFGCDLGEFTYVNWMYHTNDIAYPFYPDRVTLDRLIEEGYEIVVIDWNDSVPDFLRVDRRLKILQFQDEFPG